MHTVRCSRIERELGYVHQIAGGSMINRFLQLLTVSNYIAAVVLAARCTARPGNCSLPVDYPVTRYRHPASNLACRLYLKKNSTERFIPISLNSVNYILTTRWNLEINKAEYKKIVSYLSAAHRFYMYKMKYSSYNNKLSQRVWQKNIYI